MELCRCCLSACVASSFQLRDVIKWCAQWWSTADPTWLPWRWRMCIVSWKSGRGNRTGHLLTVSVGIVALPWHRTTRALTWRHVHDFMSLFCACWVFSCHHHYLCFNQAMPVGNRHCFWTRRTVQPMSWNNAQAALGSARKISWRFSDFSYTDVLTRSGGRSVKGVWSIDNAFYTWPLLWPGVEAKRLIRTRNLVPLHTSNCSSFKISDRVFSRSYCYTVWSAIGISLLSVRPSVCPSVCLSVTLCIVALRVGVRG